MRDTLVCNSSLSPLEAWSILIRPYPYDYEPLWQEHCNTTSIFHSHNVGNTPLPCHCRDISRNQARERSSEATRKTRAHKRRWKRDRWKTGENRVAETSRSGTWAAQGTCEVMGTQGERARYGNSSEHARLREREREQPRERQATVVETGSEPRTKGVGRPYL